MAAPEITLPAAAALLVACPLTLRALAARGASALVLHVVALAFGVASLLVQTLPLSADALADFTKAYWAAGRAVAAGDGERLLELVRLGAYGFVNLPIVAYAFTPFASLEKSAAAFAFAAFTIALYPFVFGALARQFKLAPAPSAFLLFVLIGMGPGVYSLWLGNTSLQVLLLLALALAAFRDGADWRAGALLGAAAVIKPPLLVFGVYAFLRGRWRVSLSGGLFCVGLTLASIALFGLPVHAALFDATILPVLQDPMLAFNVQSASAVIGRLFVPDVDLYAWEPQAVPETAATLSRILQAGLLGLVVWTIAKLARRNNAAATAPAEFAILLLAIVTIPSFSWSHYYLWSLFAVALLAPSLFAQRPQASLGSLVAVAGIALTALPVVELRPDNPLLRDVHQCVVANLHFLGGVCLMIALAMQVARPSELSPAARPPPPRRSVSSLAPLRALSALPSAQRRIWTGALVTLGLCLVLGIVMQLGAGRSALRATADLFWLPHDRGDSWAIMYDAATAVRALPDGALYERLFFQSGVKFQYAPTSLVPFAVLDWLGFPPPVKAWNELNRLLVFATAIGVGVLAHLALARAPGVEKPLRVAGATAAGLACLFFYPITMAYWLGQIQVWINCAFVWTCVLWLLDRKLAAGALLACACLIKPQMALFVVWALARREWRFVTGLIAVGAVGGLVSIAMFGFLNHLGYLEVLSFLSRHGESYAPNASMNGLLNRLFENGPIAVFDRWGFPPFNPLIYALTLATSLALLAAAFWPTKRAAGAGAFDLLFAGLIFTIASPIAWEHHYGVTIAMFVLALVALFAWPAGRDRRTLLALLAAAFVLVAVDLAIVERFTDSPANLVISYRYFGGLLLAFVLWRLRAREAAPA